MNIFYYQKYISTNKKQHDFTFKCFFNLSRTDQYFIFSSIMDY